MQIHDKKEIYTTHDLATAAYLMMNGFTLKTATREKSGKFLFEFLDPDQRAEQACIEFVNSESAKFDANIKNLKNIIFKR